MTASDITVERLIKAGLEYLSAATVRDYLKKYIMYKSKIGKCKHQQACDEIGVSERHMFRIIEIIEKIK